jgi:hypothetical protein
MSMLRFRSAEPPFDDPLVAGRAARLLALAETMGLWEPKSIVSVLDARIVASALEAIAVRGVASFAPMEFPLAMDQTSKLAEWLAGVLQAVRESPLPELELPRLVELFGTVRAGETLDTAESSVRRYASGERWVPDEVANRAHVIVRIVSDLAGSYNDYGIRRWFERPFSQLDGSRPIDVLSGPWDPDEPGVQRVLELAGELTG